MSDSVVTKGAGLVAIVVHAGTGTQLLHQVPLTPIIVLVELAVIPL